ncbi:hypothetical protein [Pseudoxanthomonas sp. LARHCG66]
MARKKLSKRAPDVLRGWLEPANVIAAVAVVISILAFSSSVKSCSVSQQALELAKEDRAAERSLVLSGTVDSENRKVRLVPVDSSFVLQSAKFRFPEAFGGVDRSVLPPDFTMYLSSEVARLEEMVVRRVPAKEGFVQIKPQAAVPFILQSSAVSKGRVVEDRSLYAFVFGFSVQDNPAVRPEIHLLSIAFVERLGDEVDGEQALAAAWLQTQSESF